MFTDGTKEVSLHPSSVDNSLIVSSNSNYLSAHSNETSTASTILPSSIPSSSSSSFVPSSTSVHPSSITGTSTTDTVSTPSFSVSPSGSLKRKRENSFVDTSVSTNEHDPKDTKHHHHHHHSNNRASNHDNGGSSADEMLTKRLTIPVTTATSNLASILSTAATSSSSSFSSTPSLSSSSSSSRLSSSRDMYKMAIILRNDVGMGKGKMCAQASHATLIAYKQALLHGNKEQKQGLNEWETTGQTKIVLKVQSEAELRSLATEAHRKGLCYGLVRDAGHTQIEAGTYTAVAIGPGKEYSINEICGNLKLL